MTAVGPRIRHSVGIALASTPTPTPEVIGAKAARLAELTAAGFAVPQGIALSVDLIGRADRDEWGRAVEHAVDHLGAVALAVRSSAVVEDRVDASFAGMYDTVLDVVGFDAVMAAIEVVARSAMSERVRAYAGAGGPIAVLLQHLVPAQAAGVAFTANPLTGARDEVVVVATSGRGEQLLSGEVTGEEWTVSIAGISRGRSSDEILTGGQAESVARLARRVAAHFARPQDIEWAIVGNELWLLQARPMTALRDESRTGTPVGLTRSGDTVASDTTIVGTPSSVGRFTGPARVVCDVNDFAKVEPGDVLVAPVTAPAWTPLFAFIGAVVTDGGSVAAHASVIAREYGIPAVVGTRDATARLRDGMIVTVDGSRGTVEIA